VRAWPAGRLLKGVSAWRGLRGRPATCAGCRGWLLGSWLVAAAAGELASGQGRWGPGERPGAGGLPGELTWPAARGAGRNGPPAGLRHAAACRCQTPPGLQQAIDAVVSKYPQGRAFARPSGGLAAAG
jgi:hypothetical protein